MEVTPESGVMAGRDPFVLGGATGLQKLPVVQPQQPTMQSMRLAYTSDGTAFYKPRSPTPSYPAPPPHGNITLGGSGTSGGGGGGGTSSFGGSGSTETGSIPTVQVAAPAVGVHGLSINIGGEPMKRKRGRPRKYGPDGTMALALTSPTGSGSPMTIGFSSSPVGVLKKTKPRVPGAAKKMQMTALGSAGIGFTPHVITVKAGEDVSSKIMSFSQHGPRAVCVLSANGAISNVTLRQTATSGGTVTCEGRFEILSLSGSFLLSENGDQSSRTGGLSVSLAGPDGRVLGGGVAGLLTAASPVQVVVGSFITDSRKEAAPANPSDATSIPAIFTHGGIRGPSSSPSGGTQ